MEKLIKKVIDEKKVAIFLAVIIAVLGAYSYYMLPRQESPDVSAPIAMVITPYPGASPEDINDLVTSKIEDEISEIIGFDYVRSYSKDSVSVVIVYFKNEVVVDKVMQDLRNAMSDVKGELPGGAMESKVNTDLAETAGIIVSLSGDDRRNNKV
jgi:multidrug efflux pump subunit AcrB